MPARSAACADQPRDHWACEGLEQDHFFLSICDIQTSGVDRNEIVALLVVFVIIVASELRLNCWTVSHRSIVEVRGIV